jgi:anti-anti-sigma factor
MTVKVDFIQEEKGALRVVINEEISKENVRELRDGIDARILEVKPRVLVLDISKIVTVDSFVLGLVVGRCMLMKELGVKARVAATKTAIDLLKLAKVQKIARLEEA